MPKNKIPKLREPRGPIVQQVRDLFMQNEYKQAPEDFYLQDIEMVKNMDFLLQRFVIMQRKNIEASVKMTCQVLKWRKERKLYELTDEDFPQEQAASGAAFIYENDKFGNRTIYLRASMCKNCNELKTSMKDFLSHLIFQIDDPKEGSTFIIVMDLTNTTWSNYDIDLLMHFLSLLKDYFPVNLDYVLAVNFPWVLTAAWTLIKHLIPSEKRDAVQFISASKIFEYIDKDKVPDFLGGKCSREYKRIIDKAPNTLEYLLRHANESKPLTVKRLKEILAQFTDVLSNEQVEKLQSQMDMLPVQGNTTLTADHLSLLSNNNYYETTNKLEKQVIEKGDNNNNNESSVENKNIP